LPEPPHDLFGSLLIGLVTLVRFALCRTRSRLIDERVRPKLHVAHDTSQVDP
jgi:hypothetical protein